ncbi:MAG: molybdopterin molybdotransferase MoeA [Alphaproteobacteria bacterium]|nr:molybdopterin molybdotransferase MoeA [Alphaproteobacteria bacterium]
MAQLTDSCFEAGDKLQPLEDALSLLRARLSVVVSSQTVPLYKCRGRILAKDIFATHNVPPHANSAVDGYAVRFNDLNPNDVTQLPISARIAAGEFLDRPMEAGEAVRIFTGAPLPEGADTVMMQEDANENTTLEGPFVSLLPGIKKGANCRKAGEDMSIGDKVLSAGQKLEAPQLAVAAAQGLAELTVYKPLRVALFSSGNEVIEPGQMLNNGKIYDANRPMLNALLESWKLEVTDLGILPDDPKAMKKAFLNAAKDHDLLISSAGMSVGEEDHLSRFIQDNGSLHFWKLAIKPGRPVGMGLINSGERKVPILGLPGNPVAAFLTCNLIGRVMVACLSGMALRPLRDFSARLAEDIKSKAGRDEYLRASVDLPDPAQISSEYGHLPHLRQYGQRGAAILSSLQGADGFMLISKDQENPTKGDLVRFLPMEGFFSL